MVVAKDRLEALGLATGPWLRALKQAVLAGAPADTPLRVTWRDRQGGHEATRSVGELRPVILDVVEGRRLGYVTDLRYTEENVRVLVELLADVDLLFIESVFLDEDCGHAARKNHLTARQAGAIAHRLRARAVVPFHFSPRYEGGGAARPAYGPSAWPHRGPPGTTPGPTPSKRPPAPPTAPSPRNTRARATICRRPSRGAVPRPARKASPSSSTTPTRRTPPPRA